MLIDLSYAVIVGGVVGGIAGGGLLVGIIVVAITIGCYMHRRKSDVRCLCINAHTII